ncbi:MAG: chromate transporter [Bacteroidales bacterium]|nr:chromate transporter [Bacteroidales bacterium]
MTALQLIFVFFKIGLVGFGGGYAMLSMIQFDCVERFSWLTIQEFSDIIAISQMTPGPISINTATYVGYTVLGFWGAVTATLSLCMPSIILMFFVIHFLMKNKDNHYVKTILQTLRPILAGLILAAALLLINKDTFFDFGFNNSNISLIIFILSFVVLYFFKVNPMWVLGFSGILGVILF